MVLALAQPAPVWHPSSGPPVAAVSPTWSGPAPVSIPGRLPDGTTYEPRAYIDAETSVGIAPTPDGDEVRVLIRTGTRVTELRRVAIEDHPQFDGFVVSGDTLVWAESLSRADAAVRTTLWRANWRDRSRPAVVTTDTGEADFHGGEHEIVVRSGRIYWTAVGSGSEPTTEVRSVPIGGGQVSIRRVQGQYGLSAWPWLVSPGGRGTPVRLLNLDTGDEITIRTEPDEVAACGPTLCRLAVVADNAVVHIDLQRPDGSERRRIAGAEATPTIADPALLDRFVPLKTDRGDGESTVGADLSIYDIQSGRTDLVATDVGTVQGRGGVLWWSTGTDADLTWHAIDLRALA